MAVATLLDKATYSAGELDKALHARQDLQRYQTGLAICENMVVMVEGGVTRRPGTRFVISLKDESEPGLLVPFEYSPDDSYQLVINGGVMRVLRNGGVIESAPGVPYELAVPFTADKLGTLRWAQSGNVIYFAWAGRPQVLTRLGHTTWTIGEYLSARGPVEVQNLTTAWTVQASAATGTGTLTASNTLFLPEHVGSTWRIDEGDLALVPLWLGNEKELAIGDRRRNRTNVYEVIAGDDAGPSAPIHEEGDVNSGEGKVTWRWIHGGSGYVRITAVTSPTSADYTVIARLPESAVAPHASFRWFEPSWSDAKGWPTMVRLHDNCLVWTRQDRFWKTKIGDYYDFDITDQPDSAVATRLTSPDGKLVDIQWVLNSGVLVVGTRGGEWMVRGADPFSAITVDTIRAVPDGSEGSSAHRPQLVDGGAVFIGRSRRRLHYAQFDRIAEKVSVDELTLYARNILKGAAIDLGYARDPHRILWIGQETGELAGVTFRPDQQVTGWHRHPTGNGVVENFSVLPSADAAISETWMIVRREIEGVQRRYVEVMQPFFVPQDENAPTALGAWFVDCGLSYSGPPVTRVTGADHLIGQEVAIMANGIQHRRLVVDAEGGVDLDREASSVVLGLPIKWRVRTLKFDSQIQGLGLTKGTKKKANSVYVEVLHAAGGMVSVNGGEPEPMLLSGTRALSTPQPLREGGQHYTTDAPIEDTLEVELSGDDVYPFTLLACSPHAQFLEG